MIPGASLGRRVGREEWRDDDGRAGAGIDAEAFRSLFIALAPEVRRWAARSVGPDAADDVVAETFTVAWQRRDHLPDGESEIRAWVFVVARHKVFHITSRMGRDSVLRRRVADAAGRSTSGDAADVVVASVHARDIFNNLRPEDREVLVLVGVYGLSPADAAAVLGCSMTAMTTRLSRARRRLEQLSRGVEAVQTAKRVQ